MTLFINYLKYSKDGEYKLLIPTTKTYKDILYTDLSIINKYTIRGEKSQNQVVAVYKAIRSIKRVEDNNKEGKYFIK